MTFNELLEAHRDTLRPALFSASFAATPVAIVIDLRPDPPALRIVTLDDATAELADLGWELTPAKHGTTTIGLDDDWAASTGLLPFDEAAC